VRCFHGLVTFYEQGVLLVRLGALGGFYFGTLKLVARREGVAREAGSAGWLSYLSRRQRWQVEFLFRIAPSGLAGSAVLIVIGACLL
jgi:hypothetical protein